MSKPPSHRKPSPDGAHPDRREPRGTVGSLSWFKSLLGRPLRLQRRGINVHIALVDRRRSPEAIKADELTQLRDELRARLLAHEHGHHVAALRHLVFVYDVLGHQGWHGVAAMDSRVLGKAMAQAQLLATAETSPALSALIEELRLLQVAAGLREERQASRRQQDAAAQAGGVEVREATTADFETTVRSWDGPGPDAHKAAERVP